MKQILSVLLICTVVVSAGFGRTEPATQSVSFSGPLQWIPGTQVTLNVFLTFSGYNSLGLSYWLEVPTALAPFVSITSAQYFTFLDPNTPPGQFPATFTDTAGARAGYMSTNRDLGATTDPGSGIVPGTYPITTLTLSLAANMPLGTFTMFTTSLNPRTSEVTDTNFNDNNIIPPGQFIVIIPEPSTISLLVLAALFCGVSLRGAKQNQSIPRQNQ